MPWLIIKFVETNEVEVVPSSWYNRKTENCLYPSFPKNKLEKAIKQQLEPPDEDEEEKWKEYRGELMSKKEYDNFNIANSKASKACLTSDISELEEDNTPPKRVPKKKVFDGYSDNDDSGRDTPTLNFPKPPSLFKKKLAYTPSQKMNEYYNSTGMNEDYNSTGKISRVQEQNIQVENNRKSGQDLHRKDSEDREENAAFQGEVIKYLLFNKKMLESLDKNLTRLMIEVDGIKSHNEQHWHNKAEKNSITSSLPVKTFEEFQDLNEKMKEAENAELLVTVLSRIGGANYKECTRRILSKVLVNNVAKLFTLHGHRENKQSFSVTRIFTLVTGAVKLCEPKVTEKEIELQIGLWLTKAGERMNKEKPRVMGESDGSIVNQ